MTKRPWIFRIFIILIFALIGAGIWIKLTIAEQPQEHPDPGIPQIEGLPDPEDIE